MNAPLQIRPAQRRKAKLRLGMAGPSGSGKTYSSLLIAQGLRGKIGIIDTEHGSADLYADLLPGGYDVLPLTAPYTPARYVEAIHALERAGYGVIIVDSLTHAWSGEGGSLDRQGKIADKSGNSYAAWRQVTPEHNALVEALLQSPCHIIATMRSKTDYVQEKDDRTGKQVVKKIGLAPIMRDGIEYEFTVFLEVDHGHMVTASKDRTRLFDGAIFKPTPETGTLLAQWLDAGVEPDAPPPQIHLDDDTMADFEASIEGAATLDELFKAFAKIYRHCTAAGAMDSLTALTMVKDARKATLEAGHTA